MRKILVIIMLMLNISANCQSVNHQWLMGNYYFFNDPKGRMLIDTNGYTLVNENRKMVFLGTEANISDGNGNLLMSTNGVWIANANNDTMLNGGGLNPSWDAINYPYGLVWLYANLILPFPGDSNKFALLHEAYFDDIFTYSYGGGVHLSVIDITLDSGLGALIQKNDTVISDKISMGMAACKHGNGRDWWIIAQKDSSDILYKILLTPNGIQSITTQHLGYNQFFYGNGSQLTFSSDGSKLIQTNYHYVGGLHPVYLISANFDRCTGMFFNTQTVKITNDEYLWGLAFSPSAKYIYTCSSNYVFQIDTATLTIDTVATYDGFISPPSDPCCASTFFGMYLAANGKIYITSGSSVQHIHEMNFPDSAGIASDVQQHAIDLVSYLNLRAIPNHPNYYLGRLIGSSCDTVWQGIQEQQHDFRFRIYPNPISNNRLSIGYLLPQNKSGTFSIYDVTGKVVFKYNLPQWSNEQSFTLPDLSNGVYSCTITSNNYRVSKKLVVIKQ